MMKEIKLRNRLLGVFALLASAVLAQVLVAGEDEWEVESKPHAYLGVYVEGVPGLVSKQLGLEPDVGVVVEGLVPGGPAELAGIEKHDILLKFDDQTLIGTKQIVVLVRNSEIGSKHTITYLRGGKRSEMEVELGESKPKKVKKMEEHSHNMAPMPPMPPVAPSVHEMKIQAKADAVRALKAVHLAGDNMLFIAGDDEIDVTRRMEINEEIETLLQRVNSAVEGVDGIAMPTVVIKDETQVFEFTDEEGARYVIVGEGDGKQLTITGADGSEVYNGPLDDEAKQALPEKIRDRLPRIQSIVVRAPSPPMPGMPRGEELESF